MNENTPTAEQVRASIIPKSDQLNADDLITGPITVTIENVKRGDKEQPIIVEISGHRPFRPCKSMRRILIAAYSDDPKQWVGKQMRLYCDKEVLWAGVKVGGIRISHLSGLQHPHTYMITQSRGRRSEMTILPLEEVDDIAQAKTCIDNAKTPNELKAVGASIKSKPKEVQDAVRGIYAQKHKELSAQKTPLELFVAEIEVAKDSKRKLSELSLRCDQFGDDGKKLEQCIEAFYATAKDDLAATI